MQEATFKHAFLYVFSFSCLAFSFIFCFHEIIRRYLWRPIAKRSVHDNHKDSFVVICFLIDIVTFAWAIFQDNVKFLVVTGRHADRDLLLLNLLSVIKS